LAFYTGLYGGLHAAAWHYEFASTIERLFWRMSALIIASSGACATLYFILSPNIDRLVDKLFTGAVVPGGVRNEVRTAPSMAYHSTEGDEASFYSDEAESQHAGRVLKTTSWIIEMAKGVIAALRYLLQVLKGLFLALLYFSSMAVVLLYSVARLFVIAEALASLRMLPVRAYETPDWTNFLPHW
jgi:hypothetical protein